MGIGIAILANTRPYEGLVFSIPVAIAFLISRPRWSAIALIAAVLIPAFAATAYYNRAVTGNPFRAAFQRIRPSIRADSSVQLSALKTCEDSSCCRSPICIRIGSSPSGERREACN